MLQQARIGLGGIGGEGFPDGAVALLECVWVEFLVEVNAAFEVDDLTEGPVWVCGGGCGLF